MARHDFDQPTTGAFANEPPATSAETRAALFQRSNRDFAPIAKAFIQNPNRKLVNRRGPLAEFVRNGDVRGLQAFLLLHAIISSGASDAGWSTTLPLGTWARAFGVSETAVGVAAKTGTSKLLQRLEKRRLVSRMRAPGNLVRVTLLHPDGEGDAYHRPTGKAGDLFLKFPNLYWTENWHKRLSLAATAMLLVGLHEKPQFELATEHMLDWYGFSPDTAERGLKELEEEGLLRKGQYVKKMPLAPRGASLVNVYQINPPLRESTPSDPTSMSPVLAGDSERIH